VPNKNRPSINRALLRSDRAKLQRPLVDRSRAQQGTGIDRAPISLSHITEPTCVKAMRAVAGNAKDKDDARFLLEVLGLIPSQVRDA
jgi:hypothetical protein